MLYRLYSGLIKISTAIFICSELWNLFSETASVAAIIDNVNATLIHLIALYRYQNMWHNYTIRSPWQICRMYTLFDKFATSFNMVVRFKRDIYELNTNIHRVSSFLVQPPVSAPLVKRISNLVLRHPVLMTKLYFVTLYRNSETHENKQIYKELAKSMESPYFDTTTKNRKELLKFWSQRNERFIKLLLSLGFGTLSAWNIYPLVDDVEYNLMVATRLPFNYQSPILYAITYIVIFTVFNYTSLFVMINDLIMQAHLMHLLCQFTVLADCFENILEDSAEDNHPNQRKFIVNETFMNKYLQRLNGLVEQHKFILRNTMKLKRSLSAPMLGQFAASSMLICGISFQATTTIGISIVKFFMSLLYLMYNMFELFIFCKWCDEIKIQSENISRAVYCSGWEHGMAAVPGVRSSLLLVTARAQKPLILTAGGLFTLSLASYTTLVKTSYSALTVLRRFQVE